MPLLHVKTFWVSEHYVGNYSQMVQEKVVHATSKILKLF